MTENLKKLYELIEKNPGMRVVPIVSADIVSSGVYECSGAEFGEPHIEKVFMQGVWPCFYKEIKDEWPRETKRRKMRSAIVGVDGVDYTKAINMSDSEIDEKFENLPWEDVIVLDIV